MFRHTRNIDQDISIRISNRFETILTYDLTDVIERFEKVNLPILSNKIRVR